MQLDGNTPITLTLNVDATNVILGSLSAQPYDKVANLIAAIQQQAAGQLQAAQAAAPAAEAPVAAPAPAADDGQPA
jgi:hypothetical protein